MNHSKKLAAAAAIGIASAVALSACSSGDPLRNDADAKKSGTVVVGSASFPESEILAYIYADALTDAGIKTQVKLGIGQRDRYIAALRDGEIQLVPEYTGNLLQFFAPEATAVSNSDVYTALQKATPRGLEVLDRSPAQDADSYNVTRAFSNRYHVTSLSDLKRLTIPLKVAGNPELATRPYGLPGLKSVYGTSPTLTTINDSGGPNTVKALLDGTVQLADIFTTTPAVKQNHLVTLADPEHLVVAENVVPLISTKSATAEAKGTLNAVSAKITTEVLIELDTKSAVDKESAQQIAKEWVAAQSLH